MTDTTSPDWNRGADELSLGALFWDSLAEAAQNVAHPNLGHLAGDYTTTIAGLYRQMARTAVHYAGLAREIEFAHQSDAAAEALLLACDDDIEVA